jgi:hypothetical protein
MQEALGLPALVGMKLFGLAAVGLFDLVEAAGVLQTQHLQGLALHRATIAQAMFAAKALSGIEIGLALGRAHFHQALDLPHKDPAADLRERVKLAAQLRAEVFFLVGELLDQMAEFLDQIGMGQMGSQGPRMHFQAVAVVIGQTPGMKAHKFAQLGRCPVVGARRFRAGIGALALHILIIPGKSGFFREFNTAGI